MLDSVETAPQSATVRNRSLEARRALRPASENHVEPAATPSDGVLPLAETVSEARRRRPEMAPQRLEKIGFTPGNGMAPNPSDLQHLGRRDLHASGSVRLSQSGGEPVLRPSVGLLQVARSPEMPPQAIEKPKIAPGNRTPFTRCQLAEPPEPGARAGPAWPSKRVVLKEPGFRQGLLA